MNKHRRLFSSCPVQMTPSHDLGSNSEHTYDLLIEALKILNDPKRLVRRPPLRYSTASRVQPMASGAPDVNCTVAIAGNECLGEIILALCPVNCDRT